MSVPSIVWARMGLEGHGAHRAVTQNTAGQGESSASSSTMSERASASAIIHSRKDGF